MSSNYHTPLTKGDPVEVAYVNTPMAALDAQITANTASIVDLVAEISDARLGRATLDAVTAAPMVAKTPSGETDTGTAGEIAYDNNYIYFCYGTDKWARLAAAW